MLYSKKPSIKLVMMKKSYKTYFNLKPLLPTKLLTYKISFECKKPFTIFFKFWTFKS